MRIHAAKFMWDAQDWPLPELRNAGGRISATGRLLRLLDERGAAWDEFEVSGTKYMHWTNDDGLWCSASADTTSADGPSKLHVNILYVTPEQAITATFGSDTCCYVPDYTTAAICVSNGVTGHCECEACGKSIDPWDDYCRHCGARITEVRR